jgi:CRP/FNR family transcriptional regulator, anaerobic regulatory protein
MEPRGQAFCGTADMGAFAERVTTRFRLDAEELAFLESLESRTVVLPRAHLIARAGDPAAHAFVLLAGWAMSYTRSPDGTDQVRRLHFPGDLLAMPSVPMNHHAEEIETLSDAVIAPFPKRLLARLFTLPRLAAIMYMFAQAERITAGDRIASLSGSPARERIAFLLVDILHRLRSADGTITNRFDMHLTREQIAHVTGMTPVHASRMWSAMIADGLFVCEGHSVTVPDEQRLAEISGYRDLDNDLDDGWLAEVEARPRPEMPNAYVPTREPA